MALSANQVYKKEGLKGKVPFKEWLSVQKEFGNFLNESDEVPENKLSANGYSNVTADANLPAAATIKILGMTPMVFSVVLVAVTVGIYIGVKYYNSTKTA